MSIPRESLVSLLCGFEKEEVIGLKTKKNAEISDLPTTGKSEVHGE